MAKKKTVTVKTTGKLPEGNILSAAIPMLPLTGNKVGFVNRTIATIDTGVNVTLDPGYVLKYRLVPELSKRGLVALTAPGCISEGPVTVCVQNPGREFVEIKDGDPLLEVWVDAKVEFAWEA